MKQTYFLIFLLCIVVICSFCKYSKHNNQVIENFLTDEQIAEVAAKTAPKAATDAVKTVTKGQGSMGQVTKGQGPMGQPFQGSGSGSGHGVRVRSWGQGQVMGQFGDVMQEYAATFSDDGGDDDGAWSPDGGYGGGGEPSTDTDTDPDADPDADPILISTLSDQTTNSNGETLSTYENTVTTTTPLIITDFSLDFILDSEIIIEWPVCLTSDPDTETITEIPSYENITFNQAVNLLKDTIPQHKSLFDNLDNQLRQQIGSNVTELTNQYNNIGSESLTYINETNNIISTESTCSGYIIPMKKNETLIESIINFIDNTLSPFNEYKNTTTSNDNEDRNKLISNVNEYKISIDSIKDHINIIFGEIIDLLSNEESALEVKKNSRLATLTDKISEFEALELTIRNLILSETTELEQIKTVLDNIISDSNDPRYSGKSSDGQSLKQHCFTNLYGDHVCDNQGCKIQCEWTSEIDGIEVCSDSTQIGKPNPTTYTNVFGSILNVTHNHPHKHEGSDIST